MDNTKSYKRGLRRNLRKQTLESMMRPYVPETIETEEETNQQNTVLDRAEELNDIVKCSPNGSLLNDNNRMDYGSKTVTSTDITETRLEAEQFSNNESNEEVNKTPTIEDPCTLCGSKHSPTPEKKQSRHALLEQRWKKKMLAIDPLIGDQPIFIEQKKSESARSYEKIRIKREEDSALRLKKKYGVDSVPKKK